MSAVVISGDTSGTITLNAPAVAGSTTINLPATSGTMALTSNLLTQGTSQASTSGTAISFTSVIPSWAKRITVMLDGVSTSGTSSLLIQLGTGGSYTTSGYASTAVVASSTGATIQSSTAGFLYSLQAGDAAAATRDGMCIIANVTGNAWVQAGTITNGSTYGSSCSGSVSMGGVVDSVRVTTVNGTDTFDAGVINIMYE